MRPRVGHGAHCEHAGDQQHIVLTRGCFQVDRRTVTVHVRDVGAVRCQREVGQHIALGVHQARAVGVQPESFEEVANRHHANDGATRSSSVQLERLPVAQDRFFDRNLFESSGVVHPNLVAHAHSWAMRTEQAMTVAIFNQHLATERRRLVSDAVLHRWPRLARGVLSERSHAPQPREQPLSIVPKTISVVLMTAALCVVAIIVVTKIVVDLFVWRRARWRAAAVLRRHLLGHEQSQLRRLGVLEVRSSKRPQRVYEVSAQPGFVLVRDAGLCTMTLCIHPGVELPGNEHVLAHKLMIQADEDEYLARANVIWSRGQATVSGRLSRLD